MDDIDISKFMQIKHTGESSHNPRISLAELASLDLCKTKKEYESVFKGMLSKLDFDMRLLVSYNGYEEQSIYLEWGEQKKKLRYCERGQISDVFETRSGITLASKIIEYSVPPLTKYAQDLCDKLDPFKDAWLIGVIKKASEIHRMFEINTFFGMQTLRDNSISISWSLIRMGLANTLSEGLNNKELMIHSLRLSGSSSQCALSIYQHIGGT